MPEEVSRTPERLLANPDCRDGKHRACNGAGWDLEADQFAPCTCPCHTTA